MSVTLLVGDCLDRLRELPDASVDSCVTDPPYGLAFMGKAWDNEVPGVAVWAEVLRVLKPGAHLLSFFGTRTYHRGAVNIEDAGFEIRDQVAWTYGSGFPKSKNLGEGWGTALKPAWEPIVLARKPFKGSATAHFAKDGLGGLNVDGCRVGNTKNVPASVSRGEHGSALSGSVDGSLRKETGSEGGHDPNVGRWPANLIHDGSEYVLGCFPANAGAAAPASGPTHSGFSKSGSMAGAFNGMGDRAPSFHGDTGSAARFFYCAKASKKDREDGCGSLPRTEGGMRSETSGQHITRRDGGAPGQVGNNHPTVKPTDLMAYLCRLVTPPGGVVLDPFMGSGSTGRGALREDFGFIGIELDEGYCQIAKARIDAIRYAGLEDLL